MTGDQYKTWVKHHTTLFMMTSEADTALFKAWKPLVLPYDLAEFTEGSNFIATEKSASFRTTHIDLIRQRINARKMERDRLVREDEERRLERHACTVCRGCGIVEVPHLAHVREMEWAPPYPTFGIFCFCPLGRSKFDGLTETVREAKDRGKPSPGYPLEWQKYEALVPNWSELLNWREEMRQSETEARGIARHADLMYPLQKIMQLVAGKRDAGIKTSNN